MTRGAIVAASLAFALLAAGCSEPQQSPAVAHETGSSREILTDLRRWDAATSESRRAAAEDVARRLPDFALLRMETFSCGGQTHEVAIYSHAKTGMEFVLVPVGTFEMGSPKGDSEHRPNEMQHLVTLTRPFLICRTECTQEAFERVVGANPSSRQGPALPVENVSWISAESFCTKAGLELPTEAEWEWACRAWTTTRWSFGDDESQIDSATWYVANSGHRPSPVARKSPNAFGLHDMHGNVWEWCADWYDEYPADSVTNPEGAPSGEDRVRRGGGWGTDAGDTRSANRYKLWPIRGIDLVGFRPVKSVPTE